MAGKFPDDWEMEKLEDCMDAIIDYRGKTPQKTTFGIPLITAKVVKGGRIETPDEFIAGADYDEWMRRGLPKKGDVLVTTEAPLGEVAQIDNPKVALAQRLIALRGKAGRLDCTFLKFLMQSEFVQGQLSARASGTTVSGIKQSELRKVELPLPPLREQQAIACILGALDDKIELNRRRNRTLEATARAIFQSWFVDFDPVKAKAAGQTPPGLKPELASIFPDAFEESELGEIPKGWRVGTLGELAENPRRGIAANAIAAGTAYIALEHMPRRSIALVDWSDEAVIESNKFEFRQGEILFGKLRPYFHKVGIAPINGVCSTDILVIVPKRSDWFGFVACHLSSDEIIQHADRASTGTKMPRTNWSDLARFQVVVPPVDLAGNFAGQFKAMIDRIHRGIEESRTLAAMRDTLLPKLISGELLVPDAERIVGRVT